MIVLLLAPIACEGDEKKLARLENERTTACLIAESDSALEDSVLSAIDGSAQRKALTERFDAQVAATRVITDSLHYTDNSTVAHRLIAQGGAAIKKMKLLRDSLQNATVFVTDTGDTSAPGKEYTARFRASGMDTLTDKRLASARRCALATRAYDRFMR